MKNKNSYTMAWVISSILLDYIDIANENGGMFVPSVDITINTIADVISKASGHSLWQTRNIVTDAIKSKLDDDFRIPMAEDYESRFDARTVARTAVKAICPNTWVF